ncbi:unnamed protein product [Alopecurus aequalis]
MHAGDVPPLDRDGEPVPHVEYDGQLRLHDVARHGLHGEVPQHGGRSGLHLHERHLLAEAGPWTGVEGDELVGRLVPQLPVAGDPPLRPELRAVLAPHAFHPPHAVGEDEYLVPGLHRVPAREHVVAHRRLVLERHRRVQPQALAQRRVQVHHAAQLAHVEHKHVVTGAVGQLLTGRDRRQLAQDLLLHARVLGEKVEEPRQRRPGRVPPGEQEVHRGVTQELVAELARVIIADEGRQHVGRVADAPPLTEQLVIGPALGDGVRGEAVDCPPGGGHLALRADLEPVHELPARRRDEMAEEERLQHVVHGAREGHDGEADLQAPGVDAEDEGAGHVEGETQEHVVEVAAGPGVGSVREERQEAPLHLVAAVARGEGAEARPRHEQLGLGPLAAPRLAVGVEDAVAEDVEDLGELVALGVVDEVGGEDVAHVGRVAGDEEADAGEPRASFEVVGAGQDAGGPVVEVVHVGDQAEEMAQYWPFRRLRLAYFLGLEVTVVEDEAAKEAEELYQPVQGIHG